MNLCRTMSGENQRHQKDGNLRAIGSLTVMPPAFQLSFMTEAAGKVSGHVEIIHAVALWRWFFVYSPGERISTLLGVGSS